MERWRTVLISHLNHSGMDRIAGRVRAANPGATKWSDNPELMILTIRAANQVALKVGVRLLYWERQHAALWLYVIWEKWQGKETKDEAYNWLSCSFIASPIWVETLVGQMTEVLTRGALYLSRCENIYEMSAMRSRTIKPTKLHRTTGGWKRRERSWAYRWTNSAFKASWRASAAALEQEYSPFKWMSSVSQPKQLRRTSTTDWVARSTCKKLN